MAYSSTMKIAEIDEDGIAKRSILLSGAGLPFQGAEWGTEQKIITTWYPGNGDEATQQILGPRELPSSWQGEWKRTLLPGSGCEFTDESGDTTDIVLPQTMRDLFDEIFRAGQRLRVTWSVDSNNNRTEGANSRIVREGRCSTWKFPHTRAQDIQWNFEFQWLGRGTGPKKAVSTRDDSATAAIAAMQVEMNNFASDVAKLRNSHLGIPNSAGFLTLGQLEAIANFPKAFTQRFTRSLQRLFSDGTRLSGLFKTVASVPFQLANSAVDLAKNTVAQANQFADEMGRIPIEISSTKSRVRDLVRGGNGFSALENQARIVARTAKTLDDQTRKTLLELARARGQNTGAPSNRRVAQVGGRDIIGTYVVRQGDTPQRISIRFYGSPDHAIDILRANRLPWHSVSLPVGRPVIIPVLGTSASPG